MSRKTYKTIKLTIETNDHAARDHDTSTKKPGFPGFLVGEAKVGEHSQSLLSSFSINNLTIDTLAIRKKAGRLKPTESERIMRVDRIFHRAIEVFKDEAIAKRWIKSPAKALGGGCPN